MWQVFVVWTAFLAGGNLSLSNRMSHCFFNIQTYCWFLCACWKIDFKTDENLMPRNSHKTFLLDFKLSPRSECCLLSSGWFPGIWMLCADVSEHSVHLHRQVGVEWRRGITQKKTYKTFLIRRTALHHQRTTGELFWGITMHVVVIPYRRFGTTGRSHLQESPLKMGPTGCPEMSVDNCHYIHRNGPIPVCFATEAWNRATGDISQLTKAANVARADAPQT
jgi:hypothetical protein